MRFWLIATAMLLHVGIPATAAIFTVKAGTRFYSKPELNDLYKLDLPEVRVYVPPLRDTRGFCQFRLVYKIADRDQPGLPRTGWARCVSTEKNVDLLIPD